MTSAHRLTASIDARGNRGTVTYDFAGRVTGATRKDGSTVQIQAIAVNGRSQTTDYSYDAKGNVTRITDGISGANGKQYSYDATFNQITSIKISLKHERITSFETPVSRAAFQLKQVTRQLGVRPLAVYDRGYGNASFVKQTADIESDLLLRLASNRCVWGESPEFG
jgi:YD repeat-containing protein